MAGYYPEYRATHSIRSASPRGDLWNMTVYELKDLARQHGLTGYSGTTKAELVALLQEHGVLNRSAAYSPEYRPASPRGDLWNMTVYELQDLARQRGLTGYSGTTKAQLVALLQEHGVLSRSAAYSPEYYDLWKMTVYELKDLAKDRGLTGYSSATKAQLIALLQEHGL